MSMITETLNGATRHRSASDPRYSDNSINTSSWNPAQLHRFRREIEGPPREVRSDLRQSTDQFVTQLAQQALQHRAVRHPYLQALADGSLPNIRWALTDFAHHYYGYSAHFPRYLTTLISRLENPAHWRALLENLTEESGVYAEDELRELSEIGVERAWIEGAPHPQLFQRFASALGVDSTANKEAVQVTCWRELFLQLLANGSPAEAIGALGFGTENIVRTLYGYFVKALDSLGDLAPCDTVFFKLHTAVDDHHQASLRAIAVDFASTNEGRADLRRGMLKALMLRSIFWDWMYERAIQPELTEEIF
ncbi:MAG: iron-containing redox enzyme family protein [Leptolyngbyaceae cyanobacterium MO_188.B28]|nr:iron-containing redox enzyme family protein [Leptolyngbyaceae cyanobacterium MO_188.B28]